MEPAVPAVVAAVVGVLCAIIAVAAWRAMLETGNRGIQLVSLAFALLAVKGLAKATYLAAVGRETVLLELGFSLLDLAAVLLIAWPLLRPRGALRR